MRRRACKVPSGGASARGGFEGRLPLRRLACALIATGGITAALALGGCGLPIITFQSEPAEASALPEPASTGSIAKDPTSFGSDLGAEDWRRAHAALTVALDPQGNGRPVKWDNPETALRGSVNPTGLPYVANDQICRDFLASVIKADNSRFVRGTGCKPSGGAWELKRIRAAKTGA
jgi:surface antigen